MTQLVPGAQPHCVFCQIIAGNEPAVVRYQDDLAIVFDNVLVLTQHIKTGAAVGLAVTTAKRSPAASVCRRLHLQHRHPILMDCVKQKLTMKTLLFVFIFIQTNQFDTNDIKKRNLWFLFFIFVSCSRSFYHITLRALKNWFNLLTASTRFSMEVAYEIRM